MFQVPCPITGRSIWDGPKARVRIATPSLLRVALHGQRPLRTGDARAVLAADLDRDPGPVVAVVRQRALPPLHRDDVAASGVDRLRRRAGAAARAALGPARDVEVEVGAHGTDERGAERERLAEHVVVVLADLKRKPRRLVAHRIDGGRVLVARDA